MLQGAANRYSHGISNNEKYLVVSGSNTVYIYRDSDFTECNQQYCMECNSGNCASCSEIMGYFVNETTGQCGACIAHQCLKCHIKTD